MKLSSVIYGVMLGSRKVAGLMFADDLVLLANNQQDLQCSLNLLYGYCSKWALTVNHSKTKVLVFGGASSLCPFIWSYNGDPLQQVFSYRYLGVIFTNTGSFTLAVKTFCQNALFYCFFFFFFFLPNKTRSQLRTPNMRM